MTCLTTYLTFGLYEGPIGFEEEIIMKTRLGFVSNSSSSSFIALADAKDFDDNNLCVQISIDLSDMFELVIKNLCVQISIDLSDMFELVIKNEAELSANWEELEKFGLSLATYDEIKEALKAGKIICVGKYDDESDETNKRPLSALMMQELLESRLAVVYFGRLD
jgi:hypothetical protein